ncbi:hypothetical protein MKW92_039332 [Papaver armeniacum]|nr:hypothetical protein MKW92_039332 [Papaver armeniacum]
MDNQTPFSTEEDPNASKKRKKEEPSSSEEVRNWLELPLDVLHHIFLKLGAIDILFRAQSVCSTWRRDSKDPLLFRYIDTTNHSLNSFFLL